MLEKCTTIFLSFVSTHRDIYTDQPRNVLSQTFVQTSTHLWQQAPSVLQYTQHICSKTTQGVQMRAEASNSTDPVLFKHCYGTSMIHQGPPTSTFLPLQLTVPKRFGASVLVSDTTIQLQRSFVYVRYGSKNFWWHEGDLNNSRQVLLILWLWILYSCLLYMHVVANFFLCLWQHFFFLNQFIICSIVI